MLIVESLGTKTNPINELYEIFNFRVWGSHSEENTIYYSKNEEPWLDMLQSSNPDEPVKGEWPIYSAKRETFIIDGVERYFYLSSDIPYKKKEDVLDVLKLRIKEFIFTGKCQTSFKYQNRKIEINIINI